jgi:CheY-like chemotaxis protein
MTASVVAGLVLVVDDVEGNRLLAQAYLEQLGWTVSVFANAQSALDFLESAIPEAMLIDIRMPGVRGDALATILRADPRTRRVRLIGYTAHALPNEISTLLGSGFDEVLMKPVLMKDMARVFPTSKISQPYRTS